MRYVFEIPEYKENGLTYKWEPGHVMETIIEQGGVVISANPAGLISLAQNLLSLAQDGVPDGHHMHFDDFDAGVKKGSVPLVVMRIDNL